MTVSPKTFAVNPKEWRLFKLWVALTPSSNEVFEHSQVQLSSYREVGRIAATAYEVLRENGLIKLPEPPSAAFGEKTTKGIIGAFNYTPQIGNSMPHIHVTGHFYSTRIIVHPYSMRPVFSGGVLYNIPGNSTMCAPDANVLEDVAQLKTIIVDELSDALPDTVDFNVDKIDYMGVIFGVGGLHFPRVVEETPAT